MSKSSDPTALNEFPLGKESEHFVLGSMVKINHQPPAEVIARPGNGFMLIRHEDGTTEILRPYALQWEWE